MNKDNALKLALEALYENTRYSEQGHPLTYQDDRNDDAIIEINKALAQPDHVEGTLTMVQPEQEPLEYWNAVEGWVKIDEVRKHFDSVGCGTIYKTAGEGRAPLYASPPRPDLTDADRKTYQAGHNAGAAHHKQATKPEWVGLSAKDVDEITDDAISIVDALLLTEAKLKELNT